MCRRILGMRDNELYTFAQVGILLNEYFKKNKIKAKNNHYELHAFKDICMAEGLEPGKHKGVELYPIAQKEIDRVKAIQAGKKPEKKKASSMTPLEEMAKKTEAAQAIAEEVKEPEPEKCQDVPEVKTVPDDFEAKRKKFYTDFHYFLKFAETPEERTAIINALGSLYGLKKKEGYKNG